MIRNATPDDAEAICRIYNHYIKNTTVTFETTELSVDQMRKRIEKVNKCYPWLVYQEESGKPLIGYCYADQWSGRCAYRLSLTTSIYLATNHMGKGIGTKLYSKLLNRIKDDGFHTIIAGIALPNEGSRRLHEHLGFRKVGHFCHIGYKFDKWIDVGYWQLHPKSCLN